MTVPSKIYDSFKSTDFDVEFFVAEVEKSNRIKQVLLQLSQLGEYVESELRTTVKESSDIFLTVASNTDAVIGEILSMREHFGPIKDSLEKLNLQEQAMMDKLRSKHAQLKTAMEVSALIKKINRVSVEVAKLRAQYPNLQKERPKREVVQSVVEIAELDQLGKIRIIKDDIAWLSQALK